MVGPQPQPPGGSGIGNRMNIAVARLLTFEILKTSNKAYLQCALRSPRESTRLATYYDGNRWDSYELWKLPQPDHPWQDDILFAGVMELPLIEGYEGLLYVVGLLPDALPRLIGDGVQFSEEANGLFEALSLNVKGERVPASSRLPHHPSVLYCRPDIHCDSNAFQNAVVGLKALETQFPPWLRQRGSALAPEFLMDSILLPGVGVVGHDEHITVVTFEKAQEERTSDWPNSRPVLSKVVMDLIRYFAALRLVTDLERRVRKLPFYAQTVDRYLQEFRPGNIARRRNLLQLYESKFLADRQQAIDEILEIRREAGKLDAFLQRFNLVTQTPTLREVGLSFAIKSPDSRIDLIDWIRQFDSRRQDLDDAAKLARDREAALADYLRDATAIGAARSNLELQNTIKRLTLGAIGIAVVAGVVTLFPEEAKQRVAQYVLESLARATAVLLRELASALIFILRSVQRYPRVTIAALLLLLALPHFLKFIKWARTEEASAIARIEMSNLKRMLNQTKSAAGRLAEEKVIQKIRRRLGRNVKSGP